MARPPKPLPRPSAPALPAADVVGAAVARVLAPLVRLLLASGTDYSWFAASLKAVFLDQARRELLRRKQRDTDSALSLLSGVHRKDVRAWREHALGEKLERQISISNQVFARWSHDPQYCDPGHQPRALPRSGPAPSFESLARAVTQDVHAYTVLTELIRLGLVELAERDGIELIVPRRDAFVPEAGSLEMLELFAGNLSDHAQTAVGNLLGGPAQLEQAVFAEGITEASARELAALGRRRWAQLQAEMLAEATRRHAADNTRADATWRVRFGTYFLATAVDDGPPGTPPNTEQGDPDAPS